MILVTKIGETRLDQITKALEKDHKFKFLDLRPVMQEAKKTGKPYKVGKFPYSAGSRSNAADEKTGMVKIISDGENKLLGAHILGAEAGELLPVLTYGISKGIKAEEFRDLVFIHPTLSENVWEALGEISGFSIHI